MPFLGDGQLVSSCVHCAHDDTYSISELLVVQSAEDLQGGRPPRVKPSASQRKPLWKAYPQARAVFGVGYVEDRPAAAAIVGRIITSWADVEIESGRVLAELMGANVPTAVAVFGALRNSRTQSDALIAAAEVVLDERDLELFQAHLARKASLEKERNDLAHGCFGVAASIPDHVIWVAQADFMAFSAGGGDPDVFLRKQFVYELGILERIAQEIEEFHTQFGFFRGYLLARNDGPNGLQFRSQRYPELCGQQFISEALSRIRARKRNNDPSE